MDSDSYSKQQLDDLFMDMIAYYDGDPKRIQHFTKVHSYARLIGIGEELDDASLFILEAAAYTHDIGIRVAEEKYGRCVMFSLYQIERNSSMWSRRDR